jgi:hypothetical protein
MKIRCIRNSAHKGSLTIGKTYDVLVVCWERQSLKFCIFADDPGGSPPLFPAYDFEIIDGSIPQNWIANMKGTAFELSPARWCEDWFWESFHNREEKAVRVFKEELAKACIRYPHVPVIGRSHFAEYILTEEERFALSKIFAGTGMFELAITEHFGNAQVLERKITSDGYLSVIQFDQDLPRNDEKKKRYWNFKHPYLDHGGSFIAWYELPNIIKLEAIAHNAVWPDYFKAIDFSDA